jgi:hypothetical protein
VDWHTQALLGVIYGTIATAIALQGVASRHEDIGSAYLRRRGRPKISTITMTSQVDSGHSSGSSCSGVPFDRSDSLFDTGDVSGDDSVFLSMGDTSPMRSPPASPAPGAQTPRSPHSPDSPDSLDSARFPPARANVPTATRRHGTSIAPAAMAQRGMDTGPECCSALAVAVPAWHLASQAPNAHDKPAGRAACARRPRQPERL